MVHSRGQPHLKRRSRKPVPLTEIVDCCTNCKREARPWPYVDETVKYDWKKLKLGPNDAKPCICWGGPCSKSDFPKKEKEIREAYFVETKFSLCGNKIKIQFVDNGDNVRNMVREEKERELAQQREENELRKLEKLKEILKQWEDEKNFPSCEQIPLTPRELELQTNQSALDTEFRDTPQIYILKFPKMYQYYVGATNQGYPKRVAKHCENKNSNITNDLEHNTENWEKNLLTEIMDIVQPMDKKCGWCNKHAEVLECWMQERLKEAGLSHHRRGRNTGIRGKCEACEELAKKYDIPWPPK